MPNDTTAIISWEAGTGTDVQYTWTLYDENDNPIATDSTFNTSDTIFGLTCNTDYYFIITVASVCSNVDRPDIYQSEPFNYPFNVTPDIIGGGGCIGNDVEVFASTDSPIDNSDIVWEWSTVGDTLVGDYGSMVVIGDISQNTVVTVTATSPGGCQSTGTITAQLYNLPTGAIVASDSGRMEPEQENAVILCAGDQVSLSFSGGQMESYEWSYGGLTGSTFPINMPAGTDTTVYLTVTDDHGCQSTFDFGVLVNPLPVVTTDKQYHYICMGDSTLLQANGLHDYTWFRIDTIRTPDTVQVIDRIDTIRDTVSNQVIRMDTTYRDSTFVIITIQNVEIASGIGVDSVVVSPTIRTDYQLVGVDTNNCDGTMLFHVWPYDLAVVESVVPPSPICRGDSTLLQVQVPSDVDYDYEWYCSTNPDSLLSTDSILYVTPDTTTTYFVRVYKHHTIYNPLDNNLLPYHQITIGCDTICYITAEVFPILEIDATSSASITCAHDRVILTGNRLSGANVVSWVWQRDSVGLGQGQTLRIYPEEPAFYNLLATDVNGCTAIDSVFVDVYPGTIPEEILSDTICRGGSATFEASGLNSNYVWSQANGANRVYGNTFTISPTVTTDYMLVYTSENNCTDTTFFTVVVYEFPAPAISFDTTTICRGDSIPIVLSGGSFFAYQGVEYPITDTLYFSPDSTTTYDFIVYDYADCYAEISATVNVIPFFELDISLSVDTICRGESVNCTAHGGADYLWSTGDTATTISLTPDSTTIVSLRALNSATNCTRTVYDTIVVNPLPEFTIFPDQESYCYGDEVTLTIEGDSTYQYRWNNGDEGVQIFVTPTAVGTHTYTATATNEFGCTNAEEIEIIIQAPAEDFDIELTADTICYNDSCIVRVNIAPEEQVIEYIWNLESVGNTNYFTYFPPRYSTSPYQDTIMVDAVNVNGCRKRAVAIITVNPIPVDSIISADRVCILDTIWFSTSGDNTYQWGSPFPSGTTGDSVAYYATSPTPSKIVSVTVSNTYGCRIILSKEFAIDTLPVVTLTSSQEGSYYCDNVLYTFTAAGAETYQWSTGQSGDVISLYPNQSMITVTGTDSHGCTRTNNLTMQVITSPTADIDINDTTICAGESVILTGTSSISTANYSWNVGGTDNVLSIDTLMETQTYILTCSITDHEVTCSQSDTAVVTVNSLPELTITSTSPTCANEVGTITVSGAENYEWNPHPALVMTDDPAHVYVVAEDPRVGDTLSFTVTGINGATSCRQRTPITYILLPPPAVSVTTTATNNAICVGDSATLTATGADSYQWYRMGESSPFHTGFSVVVSPTTSTTYLVIGTIATGCKDTVLFPLTVHENPTATIIATPGEICQGFSTILTATVSQIETSFVWTNDLDSDTLTGATIEVSPSVTAEYTLLVVNDSTGCEGLATNQVKVNPSPDVDITAPAGICLGSSLDLSASGALFYEWFDGNMFPIDNTPTITMTPDSSAVISYFVIGTDNNGCKDTVEHVLTVVDMPEVEVSFSAPGYRCIGEDDFLGAVVNGNHSEMVYSWSSSPVDSGLVYEDNVAYLFPDTTTTYTIHASFNNMGSICEADFTHVVEVFPRPVIEAVSETPSVCNDAPIRMSATGATHYLWTTGTVELGTDSVLVFIPEESGTYYVYGEDDLGCIGMDSVFIEIEDNFPVDSLLSDPLICSGISTEIFLTGDNEYQWSPMSGLSSFTDSSVVVTATEPITYTVTYTNIYGCTGTLEVPITLKPVPTLILPEDTTICEGEELTIRVTGATSYEWNDGTTNDFFTISPSQDTSYSVTGYISNGCYDTAAIEVHVIPYFDLSVLSTADTVCADNNSVTLTAHGAGDTYLWSTGETTPVIVVQPNQTTTYTVTAYNITNGCPQSASKITTVLDLPDFNILAPDTGICLHDTLLLSVSSDDYSYVWSTGETGGTISVSPQAAATYSVAATDFFGCTSTTDFHVTVYPLPVVAITSDDTSTCAGSSIQLSAMSNGVAYLWSSGDTTQHVTVVNETVSVYSVTVSNEYGCSSTAQQQISIYPQPTDQLTVTGDPIICAGDSVIIAASGLNTYVWSPSQSLSSNTASAVFASPDTTTEYQAVFTNEFGCVDSLRVTVNVYPPVNLEVTPDTSICRGESIQLVAENGITYLWSTGETDNRIEVSPQQDATYTVTATNEYHCATTRTIHVAVLPAFELHIVLSQDTICVGDSVILQYHGGADVIQWSTNEETPSITVWPAETSVYSLYGFNNTARCGRTVYDTVTVIQHPTFQIAPRALVCEHEQVSISADNLYPFDYYWYDHPNGSIQSQDNLATIQVAPATTTTYYCEASNQYCTLLDSVVVETAKQPEVLYEVSPDRCAQCVGEISFDVLSEYPPVTYWVNDTLTPNPLTLLCMGMYTITIVDSLGCRYEEIVVVDNLLPPSFEVTQIVSETTGNDGGIVLDSLIYSGDYLIQVYDETQTILIYEGTDLMITNLAHGKYWVQLTDENCAFGLWVVVPLDCDFEIPLKIPNALCMDCPSANYWKPIIYDYDLRDYTIEFWIYNRWGHLVYYGTDYERGWDGSHIGHPETYHDGSLVEQGVYVYVLSIKLDGVEVYREPGFINVLRSQK